MKVFLSILDAISLWAGKISSYLLIVVTIVIVGEVTMRYIFNAPTIWGLELTVYLCAATYMAGGAYTHFYRAHVRVDFIHKRLAPRGKAFFDLFTHLYFFGAVGIVFWAGVNWTVKAIMADTSSGTPWDPIIWPMRMLIPMGCGLLLLQGLAQFIRDFGIARTGKNNEY